MGEGYVSEDTRRTAEGIRWRGEDIGRRFSTLAQGLKRERVVAFGETLAGGVRDERAVIPQRRGETERAVEQELAGGGLDEVGTADNFRDAHGGIIDYNGELVSGNVVSTPDEEVSEIAASDESFAGRSAGRGTGWIRRRAREIASSPLRE